MMASSHQGLTAALDIGSSKVVCVVMRDSTDGRSQWLGLGIRPADGIRCAESVDPARAEVAMAGAVADAERSAGASVAQLVLGVACGRMATVVAHASVQLDPTIVRDADLRRLTRGARTYVERDGWYCLHQDLDRYRLDGMRYDRAPLDRFGRRLDVEIASVTADGAPIDRRARVAGASGLSSQQSCLCRSPA